MVKTLTIKDRGYNELVRIKGRGESFSDLLERLSKDKKIGLLGFAGFLSEEDAGRAMETILEHRRFSP